MKSMWNAESGRAICHDDRRPGEGGKAEAGPAEVHSVRKYLLGNHAEAPGCEVASDPEVWETAW